MTDEIVTYRQHKDNFIYILKYLFLKRVIPSQSIGLINLFFSFVVYEFWWIDTKKENK